MNRATIAGHLGADPELRHTQNGTPVLNFRVASNERRKGADGEWQDHTEWHAVVVWGARGKALADILRKGSFVAVDGTIRTTSYEAKDGSGKRYRTEISAEHVDLGGRGERREEADDDSIG
jgi:single-strand DNA-binding protein